VGCLSANQTGERRDSESFLHVVKMLFFNVLLIFRWFACVIADWPMAGLNAQHTSVSFVKAGCLGFVRLNVSLDLASDEPRTESFGSPLVTAANNVIVAVKTTLLTALYAVKAISPNSSVIWEVESGFVLPYAPQHVPLYQPVLVGTAGSRYKYVLYFFFFWSLTLFCNGIPDFSAFILLVLLESFSGVTIWITQSLFPLARFRLADRVLLPARL
jgi:hypothetical protein